MEPSQTAIWPEGRDVYENVLEFLANNNFEICSPSEVRFDYFNSKKKGCKLLKFVSKESNYEGSPTTLDTLDFEEESISIWSEKNYSPMSQNSSGTVWAAHASRKNAIKPSNRPNFLPFWDHVLQSRCLQDGGSGECVLFSEAGLLFLYYFFTFDKIKPSRKKLFQNLFWLLTSKESSAKNKFTVY